MFKFSMPKQEKETTMSKKTKRQKGLAPSSVKTIGGASSGLLDSGLNIGAAAAEKDQYLSTCFIHTRDYETMVNTDDCKCILVGRTGIGKSALISHLQAQQEHVIDIPPDEMSPLHVCDSDILKFCESAGAGLNMFYVLLWRNVIVTEILKYKCASDAFKSGKKLRDWVIRMATPKDTNAEMARRYISELESMFSDEDGFRVQEFTRKFEAELKGGFNNVIGIPLNAQGALRLTEEQRGEVVRHSEKIVGQHHMKTMAKVIGWMASDVFTDQKRRYYVTIDRLDEDWFPNDKLRLRLIRALIESVRSFGNIRPLKIVIALRTDLLEEVYAATSAHGYQEEKHRDYHLYIRWDQNCIEEMLDKRIQSAKQSVQQEPGHYLKGLMPPPRNKESAIDYMINRTFMRPRDAIMFLNECIETFRKNEQRSRKRDRLTWANIQEAEQAYSDGRLVSLVDEWSDVHPCVRGYTKILRGRPVSFVMSDISNDDIQNAFIEMCDTDSYMNDNLWKKFSSLSQEEENINIKMICRELIAILYKVGVIGIKKNTSARVSYSYDTDYPLNIDDVQDDTRIWVHPAFHRCLGIQSRERHN